MTSNTRPHIALALRKVIDDLAGQWAEVIVPYYESQNITLDELKQRSKVAIEVLASVLENGDFDTYSNLYRKLALEWISIGGNVKQLRELKERFLHILDDKFDFLDIVEDSPQPLIAELNDFLEKELWHYVATEYLEVFEGEIGEPARALPDSNESLKRLLELTGRLGTILEAGDIWEEFLYDVREIFPSMDAGAVFIFKNSKLILKGIIGFEDFILVKNGENVDFGYYDDLARMVGIRVHKIANQKDLSRLVFHRRDLEESKKKVYPENILSIPIVSDESQRGLICLYGFNRSRFFGESELEMVDILSSNLKRALIRYETIKSLKESKRDGEYLLDLQKRLSDHKDPVKMSENFLRSVEGHLGHTRSVIYLLDKSSERLFPLASHNNLIDPRQCEMSALYSFTIERQTPIFLSSQKDNPVLSGILPPCEIVKSDDDGIMGIMPLMAAGEMEGVWGFSMPDVTEISDNKRLFLTLATNIFTYNLKDILSYLHIKEQHEERGREINIAANFQQDLTPKYFRGSGYEIEVTLIPGGDLAGDFAFLDSQDKRNLILAIGDVSGRGITAGMSMMSTYGLLGELSKTFNAPGSILERLNNRLREQFDRALQTYMDEIFITCFLISAESDGLIRYAKAGHHPPLLCRKESDSSEIPNIQGVPLGIFSDSLYKEGEVRLAPGDSLVLFTDGITEARDEKGEEFGVERLQEVADRWKNYPARVIQSMIAYQFEKFTPSGSKGDDRTWIVLSREKENWMNFSLTTQTQKDKPTLSDVIEYIKSSKAIENSAVYSHVLNESLRHARDRGQSEMNVRILIDEDSFHMVFKDYDPNLKGFEFPFMKSGQVKKFPENRKAITLIREVVDFIWYNDYAKELNLYQKSRGDQI